MPNLSFKDIAGKTIISIMVILSFLHIKHEIKGHLFSCEDRYSFINSIFACTRGHTINKKDYKDLRAKIVNFIDEQKQMGNVDVVSMFFRDLEAGPTMGINEREDFIPASLLKLPNALILFELYENGEINIFKKTLSFKEIKSNNERPLATELSIVPNTPYAVDDLIFRSLAYSDNVANRLLLDYIQSIDNGRNLLLKIYRDLGILEVNDSVTSAVTTKGYSTVFRMLYNSSFLNPNSSEIILDMMSKALPIGGLRAGVPENIQIAHKFGERVLSGENKQLHDCGIVYYPNNPYELCVMTRGRDINKLQEIITYISKEVYNEFDSRKIK